MTREDAQNTNTLPCKIRSHQLTIHLVLFPLNKINMSISEVNTNLISMNFIPQFGRLSELSVANSELWISK